MQVFLSTSSDPSIAPSMQQASKLRRQIATQAKQLRAMQTRDWGDFEFALLGGNAERGMAVYRGHVQAQCIRCHDAGGEGQQAGPMLHDIGKQDRTYLLESLVEPSAKIARGFGTITLLMVDGKLHNGALLRETDTELAIVNQQGKTITVSKDDIEDRSASRESAMPKMSSVLTPLEVRDLVEYLSTLKQ